MADAQYCFRDDRAVIRVSGMDARAFLQGLISNDVEKVRPDRAIYAALLTAQGKFLHEFFVAQLDNSLLLDCELKHRDNLLRRLAMYKLRSEIELVHTDDYRVAVSFGVNALAGLGLLDDPGNAVAWQDGIAYTDPRLADIGARIILPAQKAAALADLGFIDDGTGYESLRLSLGLPDGSRDMEVEKATLLESGFEELNGVDWLKGCFLGQELTARTRYRGLVKKRLMPVTIQGAPPEPGTPLTMDGKDAGEMRSAQDGQGIALVRIDAFQSGQPLISGGAQITPNKPAWLIFQE